ncbi:MraY family glycosyltransferase [Chengkuizengella axinellae]|uniref:MraY family glycosyltransferase n=1 Tax=Chengkuizengella axinellae TaxID=3064388 RepID=A0ABT9J2F3_9BACL|nr:MraY family glycosyltransferase [Chengkuizengella sp. 2205SS18-9]MDP5275801.1 MraY family glycosyltransferase [Chengkuizengella sp. 2205SS18-9]
MFYLLPFIVAFGTVYALVPVMKDAAIKIKFVDQPSKRKIHHSPIPLMGGVIIYVGCICSMLIFDGLSTRTLSLLIGGTTLLLVGLLDDWYKTKGLDFPVMPRIIIYLLASSIPIFFGLKIEGITNLTGEGMIFFPNWIGWIVTITWVFCITNMVNFIDGVDGLATGIVTISASTLFVVSILIDQQGSATMAIIIVACCLAFLAYNFYPAKIFMGDAGAIFLGYALAILSLDGALKSATMVSIIVSVFAIGVPIFDTIFVLIRRLIQNKGLHKADNLHTHHSLMKWGLTQIQTVSFLYLIGVVFSLMSIIIFLVFK